VSLSSTEGGRLVHENWIFEIQLADEHVLGSGTVCVPALSDLWSGLDCCQLVADVSTLV